MKWITICTATVATLGLTSMASADVFDLFEGAGWGKSTGCAPAGGLDCCRPTKCPTIQRPCRAKVYTYQRQRANGKCDPRKKCAPGAKKCAPGAKKKRAPGAKKCAPGAKKCAPGAKKCAPGQCAPGKQCCPQQACEIAELIYQSQTACYAHDREAAIHELGDNYNCVCNPEVMCALVYGLNDADEGVRAKAADEIGDQLREFPCCCSQEVVCALRNALADCDWQVRRQAEEALEACGYEVVDGYCDTGCAPGQCGPGQCAPGNGCDYGGAAPMPKKKKKKQGNGGEAVPAPAPPQEPEAYFPSRLKDKQTAQTSSGGSRLSNLFGLLD